MCFLPRMLDVARSLLPGGKPGGYQLGFGISATVFSAFRLDRETFIKRVSDGADENQVLDDVLIKVNPRLIARINRRLRELRVRGIPEEFRDAFYQWYGPGLADHELIFDILESDDNKLRLPAEPQK